MSEEWDADITRLLRRMQEGDAEARAQLISIVYPQLKQIAARRMRRERRDHTLQATALVNELFLRLVGSVHVEFRNRVHFFALSSELMRNILVDAARRQRSAKRGGDAEFMELREFDAKVIENPDTVLEIDRLLDRLQLLDARQAKVVEMRYFGGLMEHEIAEALNLSERTIKRDWNMARAWMRSELSKH
jgi:RNA polymerase sigma factor (TIGR02999 family)